VDRFFSKLDLRDIKIDPFKTSFPPDADESEANAEGETNEVAAERVVAESETTKPSFAAEPEQDEQPAATTWDRPERQPHVPSWATADDEAEVVPDATATGFNGHADAADVAADVVAIDEAPPFAASAPAASNDEVLKVSARSRPSAVAGAIAGVVREIGRAEVQAIGAGATNQAVKAVAIARDYLLETGIEAVCLPAFIDVTIENEDRTAIRLVVEPR
jgi:stage V sporulation protein S